MGMFKTSIPPPDVQRAPVRAFDGSARGEAG